MVNITVDEIQRDPSKYLLQVAAGETFLILQADKAIAELSPINSSKQYGLTQSQRAIQVKCVHFNRPLIHIIDLSEMESEEV
jgi:antitoxin (DNA-binding transcriptional repressor) of toxin-antitoxin stability system